MKSKWTLLGSILAVLLLALAAGLTQAQGPEPPGEGVQPEGEVSIQAVSAIIPIQGRLTDASGNPLNGTYIITASIYNASIGGTALCSDGDNVTVSNGLFYMDINNCTSAILNGQQLYLGIKVGSDAEMTPRKAIYPVPYAFSLKPGAVISDTSDGILTVQSTGTGDADALIANAGDDGEAVSAYSPNGVGVWASSDTFLAVQGYSRNSSTNPAIFGCVADSSTTCDPYRDDNAAGVMGYSARDYGGYFMSGTSADGGVAGVNTGSGIGVYGESNSGIAIMAGGNGVIKSTALTSWAISPLKMVRGDYGSNWDDLQIIPSQHGYVKLYTDGQDDCQALLPVDMPYYLFGTYVDLYSYLFCYKMDNTADKITQVDVEYFGTDGNSHNLCSYTTDVSSASWTCRTCTPSTPSDILGPVFVRFTLHFGGDGSGRGIYLGQMYFNLRE